MQRLTRDAILQKADNKIEELYIPEWEGSVFIRVMSAGERDKFEARCLSTKVNFRASLAALVVCDEEGQRLFEEKDIEALSAKSASALDRIFRSAIKLNAMTEQDVEELEKN